MLSVSTLGDASFALPSVTSQTGPIDYTQPGPYLVGSKQVSVTRTAGDSGSFNAEIFYPATSSGSNTPLDGSGGSYPVVSFSHGYLTDALAEYTNSMTQIASYGYIVIAPLSYESFSDVLNTEHLGHDMTSAYNYLVSQNSTPASPFFNHVVTSGYAAMGHSMGGAASLSEASENSAVKTVVTWAAQNMGTPNAYTQMPNVHVPMQMIAGTQDGIVAAATTATIYADGNAPIILNDLIGGFHFGFEDFGNGIGADSGSMPRATELGYARSFSIEWLNLYMKGDQSSWQQLWGPTAGVDPQVQYSLKSGIAVTTPVNQLSGGGGSVLDYAVSVKNNSSHATSYSLFADGNSWNTSFSTLQTPVLAPNATSTFDVFVTVPPGSQAGATDNVIISARNDTDGGTRGYVQLQSVALHINSPPVVDLNGAGDGLDYTSIWRGLTPVVISDPANATVADPDGGNLASMTVVLNSPQPGDVLAADTTGTSISQSFVGGTLSLTGDDTIADYQSVLRTITYNNTAGGPGVTVETANVTANDGTVDSAIAVATININRPPVVDPNGSASGTYTNSWSIIGTPVSVVDPANATVTDPDDTNLASLTVSIASPAAHDVLNATGQGNVTVSGNGSNTLIFTPASGSATLADFQATLRTATFDNTAGDEGAGPFIINFTAVDPSGGTGTTTSRIILSESSHVTNRFLFYSGSSHYDTVGGQRGPLAFSDDNAIATDKTAYLPGASASTFNNVSSYDQGITGIMVDLKGGGNHSGITLANITNDFTFRTGNNNSPASWATNTILPTAVTIRLGMTGSAQGAGTVSGSDRVELVWANGAITQKWVEVIVKATADTGLPANDVFFFGNEIGNTGAHNTATVATTGTGDVGDVVNHGANSKNNIAITNIYDFNRDGLVATGDISDTVNHGTNSKNGLVFINVGSGGPFAPEVAPASSDAGIASVLVSSSSSQLPSLPSIPAWLASRLGSLDLNKGTIAKYLTHLEHEATAKAKAILSEAKQVADALHLDDELLDSLLVRLA